MPNTAPTEAPPPRAARGDIAPVSAGRSLKGSGSETNRDILCRLDPAEGGVPCGLYLVAGGGLNAREGNRAGSCAAEAMRAAFKETCRGSGAVAQLQSSDFFTALLGRAHDALLQARNGLPAGESFTASMVGGYYFDGVFHLGNAGNGAAYLVQNGRIQRLTHDNRITSLDDLSAPRDIPAGHVPLGLEQTPPRPAASDVRVSSGDIIILCSDGLTDRVDPVTLLEIVLQTNSPAEAVDMLFEKPALRNPAGDVSAIIIAFEKPGSPRTRFVQQIRYPGGVLLSKYVLVAALLALLGVMLYAGGPILGIRPEPVKSNPVKTHSAKPRTVKPAAAAIPKPAAPAAISVQFETTPAGAAVSVDGETVPGLTPVSASLQPGRAVITFSKTGWKTLRKVVEVAGDDEDLVVEANLEPAPAGAGDVAIRCVPACDTVHIDGAPVTGVTLPARNLVRTLPPGEHTITARRAGAALTRTAAITQGGRGEIVFQFEPEQKTAAEPRPEAVKKTVAPKKAAAPKAAPESKIKSSKSSGGDAVVYQGGRKDDKKKPSAGAAAADDRPAYVTVNVSTAAGLASGNVKFFKGDRLAAAGTAGSPIRVEPGTYNIRVTLDGFEPYQTQKHVASGSGTLAVFLKRK
jgi:protein phosphatase